MKYIVYTDGGARGNPGPAGIGAVIYNISGEVIAEVSEYIGKSTNNDAEYRALLTALRKVHELGNATEVECFLDSQLVVRQMNREYKVKDANLASLFVQVHAVILHLGQVHFVHVPREKNKEADRLVNRAIDSVTS
ncbi:MAG TPA: ribonuclease HI family protein [Patescibacteria group bacterium]|nr:ribonuclease HI family protein [Patescibacteria group bacterium]